MGNPATLRPKPFTTENQPERKGRPKGSQNRATVFKKWLSTKIQIDDPNAEDANGEKITVTLMEAAALGQIQSAMKGNTNAWKEIQDTIHGKMADTLNINVGDLTDEELEALASAKG